MGLVRPGDFLGDNPPQRVIGMECEYPAHFWSEADKKIVTHFKFNETIKEILAEKLDIQSCQAGSANKGFFLGNGGNLHLDVGFIEYCTPESLGPRQATAADQAGIVVMQRLVQALNDDERPGYHQRHFGTFRRTGTMYGQSLEKKIMHSFPLVQQVPEREALGQTNGYHENYLLPSYLADPNITNQVIPTHLVTRLWAMSGMVGSSYLLSQKAWGIGNVHNGSERVTQGKKPMYRIVPSVALDTDINPDRKWARLEVRYADNGSSRFARFLGVAATSLVLRMIEHPELTANKFEKLRLEDPLHAMKIVASDMSLTRNLQVADNKEMTALDIQEELATIALELSEKIKLPEDEMLAAYEWLKICDDLRLCDPKNFDYEPVLDAVEWAAKYSALVRKLGAEAIHYGNKSAVGIDLAWDSIAPVGSGLRWWEKVNRRQLIVEDADIAALIHAAPSGTRANIRAQKIKDGALQNATWSILTLRNRAGYGHLPDPYASDPSKWVA